ncbi:nuclear transport factor 2 family protein [Algoriphagus sp. D3-2-R+10]|uniref:nuclear transport factor 2 family protein n=1 Tax=Algoriphagus aurantiacus TaxID=3103948 RepID=UPI002B3D64E8|nr:nuclear transport factor 2 family protein [Algoriphagus sp. D3-2-R+10]MEB2773865.1 nuclear transport factor 2 family protein [Algoriphagus sp. D3-2-R+10]
MTGKHPNIQLIESFFKAYSTADFEGMRQVMSADIKWHIPGKHPFSGTKNGITELMEYLEKLNQFGFKAEQIVMGVNDNYVIDCHRNWSTSSSSVVLNAMSCLLWKIEDSKIVEVFNFPQDQKMVDVFFNKVAI